MRHGTTEAKYERSVVPGEGLLDHYIPDTAPYG